MHGRLRRGIIITLGMLTILAGGMAIIVPRITTYTTEFIIGMILVFDGILQGIYACQLQERTAVGWRGLGALLASTVGIVLIAFPSRGALTLALLIAVFLLISGGFKIMLAFQSRAWSGSRWILISGVASIILGLVVLWQWPERASWVIGVVVGVDLIFSGWRMTVFTSESGKAEADA